MKPEKPLTDKELEEWESSRDLDAELLDSVRQMKAGKGHVAMSYQEQVKRDIEALNKVDKQDNTADMGDYLWPYINGAILRFALM